MTVVVDHRPYLERGADRAVRVIVLGIVGCALLGAGLAAGVVVYLTAPRD